MNKPPPGELTSCNSLFVYSLASYHLLVPAQMHFKYHAVGWLQRQLHLFIMALQSCQIVHWDTNIVTAANLGGSQKVGYFVLGGIVETPVFSPTCGAWPCISLNHAPFPSVSMCRCGLCPVGVSLRTETYANVRKATPTKPHSSQGTARGQIYSDCAGKRKRRFRLVKVN